VKKTVSPSMQAIIGGCILLAAASGIHAATAEVGAAEDTSAKGDSIPEVIVTARRTQESIQSVPVTVTAFDAKSLQEKTISTPEDLQLSTPGVSLSGTGGRENVVYEIRGQSKALSGPSSPAVVSYFAEVPDPVFGSFVPQYDMESIQILKGPQGTLFGRNTTGGAILYAPQAPTNDFGGNVGVSYGNFNDREFTGVVNLPLVKDVLALRIAGDIHRRDGYTKNLGVGGDLDAVNTEGFRASLLFQPTDYLKNTTIYDYFHSSNAGFGTILTHVIPGTTLMSELGLQGPGLQQLALQQARGPFVTDSSFPQYERDLRNTVINRTELKFKPVEVVNIFGYRATSLAYATNVDGMPIIAADGTGAFPAGVPVEFIKADLHEDAKQLSDELQVRGDAFDSKFKWLAGAFWLQNTPTGPQGNTVSFAQIPGTPLSPPAYNFITEQSKAVYLHGTYGLDALLHGLQIELGARYTKDDISSCTGVGINTAAGPELATSDQVTKDDCTNARSNIQNAGVTDAKSDATTWSAGLNWQITDDMFTYVVARHGYRAGGVNGPTLVGRLAQFQTFSPETVTDAEVGIRADWTIDSVLVRTNVSAFTGRYKNVQTVLTGVQTSGTCNPAIPNNPPGVSPDGDCNKGNDPAGGTLLVNLGEAQVSGMDADLVIAPMRGLSFDLSASFLNPRTVSFNPPASLAPYVSGNGLPFNFAARWTGVANMRYVVPFGNEFWHEAVFNSDSYWTGRRYKGDVTLPSYSVTNMRLDFNGVAGSSVDVGLFVKNLFDREYVATANATGLFLGLETDIFGPPRMYGLQVRYNF
jgi:iron complex outermembrane receptor protein